MLVAMHDVYLQHLFKQMCNHMEVFAIVSRMDADYLSYKSDHTIQIKWTEFAPKVQAASY